MMIHEGSAGPRRLRLRALFAGALGLVILCTAAFAGGVPARAAVSQYTVNFGGWVVGGFVSSNGQLVYCVEPGAFEPLGAQQAPVKAATLPGFSAQQSDGTGWSGAVTGTPVSGDALRRMNWLLTTYGQTTDPDLAAAVQFAVWFLREDPGVNDWLVHHVLWVQANGGTWHTDRAYGMVDEAYAAVNASSEAAPDAPLGISLGDEFGSGTVTYPAGTTRLDISGAAFEGGASGIAVGPEAGTADWSATLHESGWEREREVVISGEWEREVTEWPAELMLHLAEVPGQQSLGSMVGPVPATKRVALEPVSVRFDSQFQPALSTQSEAAFVRGDGGRFADRVTMSLADASVAPWASRLGSGGETEFAPVVAKGVLYGPFARPPEESGVVPADAPVAARAEVVADRGPGEYLAVADHKPSEAGYYSWVWSIDESEQQPAVRAAELLPQGYRFADRFGLANEGQVAPMTLRWQTELQEQELPLDQTALHDQVAVSLQAGEWLQDAAGEPLPVRLRLTAYAIDAEPEQSAEVPEEAREIGHVFTEVTGPGSFMAPPIALPFELRGWVTVRTCLFLADQEEESRDYVDEWCDDFGVAAESAEIVVPRVRTEAQPETVVGDTFRDTAFVEGLVPQQADIGFVFYLRPEAGEPKYDESWAEVTDEHGQTVRWSADEIAQLSAAEACLAQPVAITSRVPVAGAGSVESPRVIAKSAGTGYWVEDLAMLHPETGEATELHRGACGLENERTVILRKPEPPQVPLAMTGGLDPRLLTLGAVPIAGLGLALLIASRRHMQNLCSSRK